MILIKSLWLLSKFKNDDQAQRPRIAILGDTKRCSSGSRSKEASSRFAGILTDIRDGYSFFKYGERATPKYEDFASWDHLRAYVEGNEDNEDNLSTVVRIIEEYGDSTLEKLKEFEQGVLKAGATDPKGADILLSTVHQAKGLEWDRVVVLDDFEDLSKASYQLKTNSTVER